MPPDYCGGTITVKEGSPKWKAGGRCSQIGGADRTQGQGWTLSAGGHGAA